MTPDGGSPEPTPDIEAWFERTREAVLASVRGPLSTYRLQLHAGFPFDEARRRLSYLSRLGVGDIYLSPILRAAPGSTHGYDVIDHVQVNPELGGEDGLAAFVQAVRAQRLGVLLDTVPNHMGIATANPIWLDVLENGPASRYAHFFDVEWDPVKDELHDKVLLPILGGPYGDVLEKGELKIELEAGAFRVRYFDHVLPLDPRGYAELLRPNVAELTARLGAEHLDRMELESILTAISHLPSRSERQPEAIEERAREKEVVKRRLAALVERSPEVRAHIAANLVAIHGRPGDARSFDALDRLLTEHAAYRLAYWRVAGEEINYRRFFDVNSLAAIRVEEPEVFEHAHQRVFPWLAEGWVTGLRIDHPDGLFDPTGYFLALQERHFLERARGLHEQGPPSLAEEQALRARWRSAIAADAASPLRRALYVVVEKIQGGRERIPDAWAVHGTTGYRFANACTALFIRADSEQAMTETYERFIGAKVDYEELLFANKMLVLRSAMASEVNVLARELNRISEMNRRTRDYTLNSLRRALEFFVALFPVYRTYVDAQHEAVDPHDVQYIEWTLARAKARDATTSGHVYDFLGDILLRRHGEHLESTERTMKQRFALKLQQLTGPVMAKGLEDTTFYVYNRLVALNEVGGEPETFGLSEVTFHVRNQERAERWPLALLGSSTHDTKRSEDLRARISVLSEVPAEWRRVVRKWAKLNGRLKGQVEGKPAPSANDEYLFYQTLVGIWPMGDAVPDAEWEELRRRLREYMLKAAKEAKVHTSWTQPDPRYEEALGAFVDGATDPQRSRAFLRDAREFKRRIERPGQLSSLSQMLLKLMSPGVPDVYQGSELWDLALVDPDNRRPVDFDRRERLLDELDRERERDRLGLARRLWEAPADGAVKLYVLSEALRLRRARPALFQRGAYHPIEVNGVRHGSALAFTREHAGAALLVAVPRLVAPLVADSGLGRGLAGTQLVLPSRLAPRAWVERFTGRTVRAELHGGVARLDLAELLEPFPVALLEAEP